MGRGWEDSETDEGTDREKNGSDVKRKKENRMTEREWLENMFLG